MYIYPISLHLNSIHEQARSVAPMLLDCKFSGI